VTCCVYIGDAPKGTGWLADRDGLVITAGHFLDKNLPCRVHFTSGDEYDAQVLTCEYDQKRNLDFGVLKINGVVREATPLSGLRVMGVVGAFCARGYGEIFKVQSTSNGHFLGSLGGEGERLFKLDSKQLGSGFSGAAIFSMHFNAVVGIQIESTIKDSGPERDSHLAMPLSRIASECSRTIPGLMQIWPDLYGIVRERFNKAQHSRVKVLGRAEFGLREKASLSPLHGYWEEFLFGDGWHSHMQGRVEEVRRLVEIVVAGHREEESCRTITETIRRTEINWNGRYDDLCAALLILTEGLLDAADNLRKDIRHSPEQDASERREQIADLVQEIRQLREQLRNPQFNRCMCVMGPLGSGKTHFLQSLLASEALACSKSEMTKSEEVTNDSIRAFGDRTYVLMIERRADESLALGILRQLREATQLGWSSLADFDSLIGADEHDARLVIAIDDLHGIVRNNTSDFLLQLCDMIKASTEFRSVYWVLMINATDYWRVAAYRDIWRDYAFQITTHRNHPVTTIGGWIPIQSLNKYDRLGYTIIRRHSSSEDGTEDGVADVVPAHLLPESDSLGALAGSPSLAWLLIDLRKELPVPMTSILGLRFLQVVVELGRRRLWRAIRDAEKLQPTFYGIRVLTLQAVHILARLCSKAGSRHLELAELMENLIAQSRASSTFELRDAEAARLTTIVLQDAGLIEIDDAFNEHSVPRHIVRFVLHAFWECMHAVQFLHDNLEDLTSQDRSKFVRNLLQQVRYGGKVHGEGLLEFILLLIDFLVVSDDTMVDSEFPKVPDDCDVWSMARLRERIEEPKSFRAFADDLWHICLHEENLSTATVYFAATKCSNATQDRLLQDSGFVKKSSDGKTIFAYLYFLAEGTHAGDGWLHFRLVRKLYKSIKTHSLEDYFVYFTRKQLVRPQESGELLKCLMSLQGCEVMTVQRDLARVVADGIRDSAPDTSDRLAMMAEYVRCTDSKPMLHSKKGKRSKKIARKRQRQSGPWRRWGFREWILHFVCMDIAGSMIVDEAYDLFRKTEWYVPGEHRGIGRQGALEMEREANIALGSQYYRYVYRRNGERLEERFVGFVGELSESPSLIDRRNAFHIIRHTEKTEGRRGVRVRDVFQPALRKLASDVDLVKQLDDFREMFRVNLEERGEEF
jgi:hypothetical protein